MAYKVRVILTILLFTNGMYIGHGVEFSNEYKTAEESTLASLVKEVEDNSRYKSLEANATLLKLLVDEKDGVSRSEVFDMLNSRDDDAQHIDLPTFPEDSKDIKVETPSIPDLQAEFLQAPDEQVSKDLPRARYHGAQAGKVAVIMVVVTCSIVLIGYSSLVIYRRIYLKSNGLKHELLRNEENVAETRIEL